MTLLYTLLLKMSMFSIKLILFKFLSFSFSHNFILFKYYFLHLVIQKIIYLRKFLYIHYFFIYRILSSMKILKVIRFNYKIILSFTAMVSLFSFLFSFSFAKSNDEIELPIIMYHSLLKSQKSTYIVHPNTF